MSPTLKTGALLLLCAACEPPPVHPTSDYRQNLRTSRIEGEVVATTRARGNAVLFLYHEARPPPPAGSGRPISFAVVPGERLFAGAAEGGGGPFASPFTFSLVPPGRYLIRAFLDPGEDFLPWYGVTAEPNAGDVGGAAVDALTRKSRVLEIAEGALLPVQGVAVSISEPATFGFDRPVFSVSPPSLSFTPSGGAKLLELSTLAIDQEVVHQRSPVFLARYADEDGDGRPEDRDGDGSPDLWPKVVVRKLAGPTRPLQEENVVLAAGLDPTEILPLLTEGGQPKMTPVPLTRLKVMVKPLALDVSNPSAPSPLSQVPSGLYGVVLVQFTGQTWRVPNELSPTIAPSLGLPPVKSQAFAIQVP